MDQGPESPLQGVSGRTERVVKTAKARGFTQIAAAAVLGVGMVAAPALTYAQHAPAMGGGHMGGVPHIGGVGGAHFSGGHAGFAAPHMGGYGGPRYSPGRVSGYAYHGASGYGAAPHYGYPGARVGYVGHAGTAYNGGAYYGGYYHGGSAYYQGGHYWGGGYWHGGYWPYCYYRPGFVWFYPVLPVGYATFWWGGVPYYYWNNLYYTYNTGYNGYVVTDPPPVNQGYDDSGTADPSSVTAAPPAQGAAEAGLAGSGGTAGDIYVYPRNGQTEAQTSTDRYECHSWAVGQTGFDPTRATQAGGTPADYRRAMIACLDARGYSARGHLCRAKAAARLGGHARSAPLPTSQQPAAPAATTGRR